jgi:hypothetical protein
MSLTASAGTSFPISQNRFAVLDSSSLGRGNTTTAVCGTHEYWRYSVTHPMNPSDTKFYMEPPNHKHDIFPLLQAYLAVVGKWPQLANTGILVNICLINDVVTRDICSPGKQCVENRGGAIHQSIKTLTIVILVQQPWHLQISTLLQTKRQQKLGEPGNC